MESRLRTTSPRIGPVPVRSRAETLGDRIESFESHRNGVSGVVDGDEVVVGHPDLFRDRGWTVPADLQERIDGANGRTGAGRDRTRRNRPGVVVVGDDLREGGQRR